MLLDLVLPGMNGMDVLRACGKNNHERCIIVVTSYGSEATAVEAIQEGADDYVVKGFMLMNDDGNILGFNDAFVKMTGIPERELFNMRVFGLIGNEFRNNVR